jgi:predicted Rossmann-fold nucleotide-binding protein
MFVKYSQGFVVMPGGFGIWMNCLKRWLLFRQKIAKFPIILVRILVRINRMGEKMLIEREHTFGPDDLNLIKNCGQTKWMF